MKSPLPAGSTGQMPLIVRYQAGEFCTGDEVITSVDRSATFPDPIDPNPGPTSASVSLIDNSVPFPLSVPNVNIFLNNTATLNVNVTNGNTIIDELTGATLSLEVPEDVEIGDCDGCIEGDNQTGPVTLTWNVGTVSAGNLPSQNVEITFPDDDFEEEDMITFNATLTGMDEDCENAEIELEAERKLTIEPLPDPEPRLQCVSLTIDENEIGETGTLAFSFKNNSNINGVDIDGLMYDISIPNAMGIQTIPDFDFSSTGLNYDIIYSTVTIPGGVTSGPTTVSRITGTPASTIDVSPAFITDLTLVFSDPVPVGFMPVGTIDIPYEVLAIGLDGNTIEGANPRIPNTSACNALFDDLSVSSSLSGTYESQPVPTIQNQTNGCNASLRVADPRVGPQGIVKRTNRTTGTNDGYFPQETVVFTLEFQQCGDQPLTSTVITDNLPAGLTLFGDATTAFTYSDPALNVTPTITNSGVGPSTITWNVGSLPGAATADECVTYTITFEATVNDDVKASTLYNCFDIDGQLNGNDLDDCNVPAAGGDNSTLEDCVPVKIRHVGPADLTKVDTDLDAPTSSTGIYFPGEEIEYTIGWTIESMFDASDVVVTDVLPPGISFESFDPNTGYNIGLTGLTGWPGTPPDVMVSLDGQTLTWDFGSLEFPGDNTPNIFNDDIRYEITYRVRVDEGTLGNYQNCFTVDGMMGDNIRMTPETECNTINVRPVGPVNPGKSSSVTNVQFPGEEIPYTITFQNQGPFNVPILTIVDNLPDELEYVEGSVGYPDVGGTQLPTPNEFVYDEITNSLSWTWENLEGAEDDQLTTGVYTITFITRVRAGTPADTPIRNCIDLSVPEPEDLAAQNTPENQNLAPRRQANGLLYDDICSNIINVLKLAQVDSRKGIKGECDEEFKYFDPFAPGIPSVDNPNGIGFTFEGGSADYRLEICNTGNVKVDEFLLIDILPWIGDIGVVATSDRLSEWRPNFAGLPEINMDLSSASVDASDFTIFYSVEQSPCRGEFFAGSGSMINITPCSGPVWSPTPPADIARVQSIKIQFNPGVSLEGGAKIVLEWDMFAPVNTPAEIIAWNSFAYQGLNMDNGLRFLVAEPNKVGIAVKDDPKAQLGDYVWVDRNDNGVQDESSLDGVNGITVELYKTDDMTKGNDDDMLVATAVTGFDYFGNPGYYLFPNLDAGKYYVDFDESTLPATTSVIVPNQGNDDAIDSDGDQVMAMDEITELEEGESDRTHDLGLVPPDCDLSGTIVAKECIANDPEDLDDDEAKLNGFTVFKENLDSHPDDNGNLIAGGATYTVIIESCTASEVEGEPATTEQLYVQGGFSYGVPYGFGNGATPIPGLEDMEDAIFAAPEGTDIKILFLDDENPLCYEVNILSNCSDYGDLPDTYGTTGPDAPRHTVDQDLKLGDCIDSELDGLPDDMAGSMETGGDDNNEGVTTVGECAEGGDDEDGITFVTPMIPGEEACIEVTAMNMTGSPAVLQMWVDWNGDGDFVDGSGNVDTDEEITLNHATFGDNEIPADVTGAQKYCFTVPSDAKFKDGNAFVRFRLSEEGGLAPDSQEGAIPIGEIEDYKLAVAKIGNIVFEDYNFNGIQDAGEPGINDVTVTLTWFGPNGEQDPDPQNPVDDETYTSVVTGPNGSFDQGEYYFCGLIEGDYKIKYTTPNGANDPEYTATRPNIGSQADGGVADSDGALDTGDPMDLTMAMEVFEITDVTDLPTGETSTGDDRTPGGNDDDDGVVGDFPDDQTDETHDQGFARLDYGDLPDDPDDPNDFPTLMEEVGAVHTIFPGFSLGTNVDSEDDGNPDPLAGLGGTTGDDADNNDDEDGVVFNTPLIPGNVACVDITVNLPDNLSSAIVQGWIDWDGMDDLDPTGEALDLAETAGYTDFFDQGAYTLVAADDGQTRSVCFDVPSDAKFNKGMVYARFRLSPTGGLAPGGPEKYPATGEPVNLPIGEVEDYKLNVGKVGNLVFEDYDFDGVQDDGEPGINGVQVQLVWGGVNSDDIGGSGSVPDIAYAVYTTGTDNNLSAGEYYFCGLIPGDYKLIYTPDAADELTPTRGNNEINGDDEDSDGVVDMNDLTMIMEVFTIEDVTNLPTDENGLDDDNKDGDGIVNDFPNDQVDETHDQGFARIDYGDLPDDPEDDDDFETLMEEGGAVHTIFPGFSLGSAPDSELDGQPDVLAGLGGATGDDGEEADDEDGVVFNTPLIPGNVACVDITVNLPDGISSAVVQGWIDWDGDSALDPVNEDLDLATTTGYTDFFDQSAYTVGTADDGQKRSVCFDVPGDAKFNDGMVYARFRLSPEGGLAPDGPTKFPGDDETPVNLPLGEVEDYKVNVGKLGNYVWEDYNYDGLQDAAEPAINGVEVQLTWAGLDDDLDETDDNITYASVFTGANSPSLGQLANGQYYFCGLIEGTYKITVITPDDMTPGLVNQGGDDNLDSDGLIDPTNLGMVMTAPIVITDVTQLQENEDGLTDEGDDVAGLEPNDDEDDDVGTFPDNQVDERYDFAFNGIDYGDQPDSYGTTTAGNGPKHILQPDKFLGSCVDAERDGQPNALAGLRQNGDDGLESTYVQGDCDEADDNTVMGDDENGVSFPTPLVPGYEACIEVTYTAKDFGTFLVRDDVFLTGFIDFNGDGDFSETNEKLVWTKLDDVAITQTTNVELAKDNNNPVTVTLCFVVPSEAEGTNFAGGKAAARFRLNCETDPAEVTPTDDDGEPLVGGEVEDYWVPVAKIGQYTWYDNDLNGDQEYDPSVNPDNPPIDEVGINDVQFVLIWDGNDGTFDDGNERKYIKTSAVGVQGETEDGAGGTADGIYYFCGLQEGKYQIIPLKYANADNVKMDEIEDEFGNTYDLTDPDSVTINDGTPTPRYALTPNRKILTRPDDIVNDDLEDSDGAPITQVITIPDLTDEGLITGEDGNGDLPEIYGYPDTLTNMSYDFGWVQEPNIEVLQRIVGVAEPESGECDHFNVIVDVCLVNTAGYMDGNFPMGVPLKNLSLMGDLSTQLGATFVDVVSTQLIGAGLDNNNVSADITVLEYDETPAAPQQYPTLNPNYDGGSDKNLFADNTGYIWPGEKVMVRYVFEVAPEEVDMMTGIDLEWNVMGAGKATNYDMEAIPDYFDAGNQYMAMDLSSDYTRPEGIEIDWTYDDPDDPTNLGDCWKKASQFAANDQINFSANADCEVIVEESNLIQPYYPECDEDVYPLGGYYRFLIEGTDGVHYLPTLVDAASIVNDKIRFAVYTVNKACEPR